MNERPSDRDQGALGRVADRADGGISVLLFESEDAARGAAAEIRNQGPPPGAPVALEAVHAYEVLARA